MIGFADFGFPAELLCTGVLLGFVVLTLEPLSTGTVSLSAAVRERFPVDAIGKCG